MVERERSETQDPEANTAVRHAGRMRLLFTAAIFQGKLLLDGLRDVLLVPISLVAVLAGVLFGGDRPGRWFERLLELGRHSDRFINLFNQHDGADQGEVRTADELVEPYRERWQASASNSEVAGRVNRLMDRFGESLDTANSPPSVGRERPGSDTT